MAFPCGWDSGRFESRLSFRCATSACDVDAGRAVGEKASDSPDERVVYDTDSWVLLYHVRSLNRRVWFLAAAFEKNAAGVDFLITWLPHDVQRRCYATLAGAAIEFPPLYCHVGRAGACICKDVG